MYPNPYREIDMLVNYGVDERNIRGKITETKANKVQPSFVKYVIYDHDVK